MSSAHRQQKSWIVSELHAKAPLLDLFYQNTSLFAQSSADLSIFTSTLAE